MKKCICVNGEQRGSWRCGRTAIECGGERGRGRGRGSGRKRVCSVPVSQKTTCRGGSNMNREAFVKEAGPTSPRIMMQKGKDGVCAARRQMIMAMSLTQDSRAYCANEMSVANENESEGTGQVNVGMSSETSKRIGVVVVDHGSKKERANEMLLSFADMFRDAFRSSQTLVDGVSGELEEKEVIVESAHMELATPSIEDAIRKLYFENEIQLIVVAPFFLAHGRYAIRRREKSMERNRYRRICLYTDALFSVLFEIGM